MPGQPSPNIQRFSPSGESRSITPDQASSSTYRCPRCHAECPTFQLRPDVYDVPRRVNVTGCLCAECRETYEADNAVYAERIGCG